MYLLQIKCIGKQIQYIIKRRNLLYHFLSFVQLNSNNENNDM